ncbi:MAG TPA: FtsX-like permease family protein [Acidimicrobiales bacterium]
MWRVTVRNLLAHKLRLLTTAGAIVLGVAFMAGSLVLSDTITRTFDDLFADVNAGTDAVVRSSSTIDSGFGTQRQRVDEEVVGAVEGVDGVAAVAGQVQGYAELVGTDGEPIGDPGFGAPSLGVRWSGVEALNPFDLVDGRPPEAGDEVVIDKASADEGDVQVGDRVRVLLQGPPQDFTVVGIARFGSADSPLGATVTVFAPQAAQELLGEPGKFDLVAVVAEDGVSQQELVDRLDEVIPAGTEAVTGDAYTEETQSDVADQLGFVRTFLLVFAGVALFVGSFVIFNTFSILVAQRTRELALLRAVGASRRQVLGSVLGEALLLGLVGSVLGVLGGLALAGGLKGLFAGLGFSIPASGTVLTGGTVAVSVVTGLVVTMVAAVLPAVRASRVPPVAAMRDVVLDTGATSTRRVVVGVVMLVAGAASLVAGLVGGTAALVGVGAAAVVLATAVLGPAMARPVTRVIGAPVARFRGVTGALARENAARNPRRTASTAIALVVGVALVGLVTIFASSAKESIVTTLDRQFTGDLVVDSGSFVPGTGLSPDLARRLNELPEVGAATGLRFGLVQVEGKGEIVLGVDPATAGQVLDLDVRQGSLADLDETGIAVLADVAEERGWQVGDEVDLRFAETGEQRFTVRAVYGENELAGNYTIGYPAYDANLTSRLDLQVYVTAAEGTSVGDLRAAVEEVTADYPSAKVQDREEYTAAQAASFDPILGLVYALLGLAVVIALFGIANTLALSVVERTRELGLLRAVGMTRAQVRAAVRWEAVIIALFGTALGLAIGVFFGWALVEALQSEATITLRIPVGQLAVVAVVAALAGVLAAILPARRAARLDVLAAIATQ